MAVTIYHNPRCSKSRQTLKILSDRGIQPRIVEYLRSPPSTDELEEILTMLDIEPRVLIRKNETAYKQAKMANESLTRRQLVELMVANPIVIERPVVVKGKRAVIGRPPENVLSLL